jgi:hypothetical protein
LVGGVHHERGLADPRHSADQVDAPESAWCGLEQQAQLTLPTGEGRDVTGQGARGLHAPRWLAGCLAGRWNAASCERLELCPGSAGQIQGIREKPRGFPAGRQVDASFQIAD